MTDKARRTLDEFNDTSADLLNILDSASQAELNHKPRDKWSLGQIGDHLLKSYASVDTLRGNTETPCRPMEQKVGLVKQLFLDRSVKMDSPEAILPARGSIDKADLIKGIEKRFQQTRKVIENKDLSLICKDYAIAQYGPFTRYEWIWFNIYHTQRHIQQMKDLIDQNRSVQK